MYVLFYSLARATRQSDMCTNWHRGGGGGGYSDILMKLCFLVILSLGKRDTCFKMSKARLFKDLKNVSIDYNKK